MSAAPTLPTARPEQDIPACSGAIVQTEGNGGLPKATGKLMSTPGRPLSREHARDRSPPASAQKRRTEPAIDASATKKRAVSRDSCAAADAPQRPERRALRADQIDFSQDSDSGGIRLEELVGRSLLEELEHAIPAMKRLYMNKRLRRGEQFHFFVRVGLLEPDE